MIKAQQSPPKTTTLGQSFSGFIINWERRSLLNIKWNLLTRKLLITKPHILRYSSNFRSPPSFFDLLSYLPNLKLSHGSPPVPSWFVEPSGCKIGTCQNKTISILRTYKFSTIPLNVWENLWSLLPWILKLLWWSWQFLCRNPLWPWTSHEASPSETRSVK